MFPLSEGTSLLADTAAVPGHKAWQVKPELEARAPMNPLTWYPIQPTCCPEPDFLTPYSARSSAPLDLER